jgi:hypothetical protein
MKRTTAALALISGLAFLATGCGSGADTSMMSPSPTGSQTGGTLMSVTPQGGATGVAGSTSMVLRFSGAMGSGMEQYVDMHMGDLSGATMPMNCVWSGDRTTLTCTPQGSLSPHTTYVMHLGGGMTTQTGQAVDCTQYGPSMGGQWIQGGMMGSSHAGSAWTMMGSNWHNANGSYGMAFTFTTA